MARYTADDQEFFFEMANKILDRFGLLDDIKEEPLENVNELYRLDDVKEECIVDVIEFYSDLLVNAIDVFVSWKSACRKRHLKTTEEEIDRLLEEMEKQTTTEALSQEC